MKRPPQHRKSSGHGFEKAGVKPKRKYDECAGLIRAFDSAYKRFIQRRGLTEIEW